MPPRGVKKGTKRARQYEHIKQSERQSGASESRAEEIAARTVNKERARSGESRTRSSTSTNDLSSRRRGGLRYGDEQGQGPHVRAALRRSRRRMRADRLREVVAVTPQEVEERPDLEPELRRMAHLPLAVDRILVPPPLPLTRHVALGDEVSDDPLGRPLRDPDALRDVPQPRVGIRRDAEQNLCVICDEMPVSLGVSA